MSHFSGCLIVAEIANSILHYFASELQTSVVYGSA